jgi:hypothetical protein
MTRRRAWYLLLLVAVGIVAALYGAISGMRFWLLVGLAWVFLAVINFLLTRGR